MQTNLSTEDCRKVFNEPTLCGCGTLSETGSDVIAESARIMSEPWSTTTVAFRDEVDSAIELLDLTLGDWEPEAYEGWTSI